MLRAKSFLLVLEFQFPGTSLHSRFMNFCSLSAGFSSFDFFPFPKGSFFLTRLLDPQLFEGVITERSFFVFPWYFLFYLSPSIRKRFSWFSASCLRVRPSRITFSRPFTSNPMLSYIPPPSLFTRLLFFWTIPLPFFPRSGSKQFFQRFFLSVFSGLVHRFTLSFIDINEKPSLLLHKFTPLSPTFSILVFSVLRSPAFLDRFSARRFRPKALFHWELVQQSPSAPFLRGQHFFFPFFYSLTRFLKEIGSLLSPPAPFTCVARGFFWFFLTVFSPPRSLRLPL